MIPKTKIQHQVVALAEHLPPLPGGLQDWAYEKCLKHKAYRTKHKTSCLDCGHVWDSVQDKRKQCTCPNCNRVLKVSDTKKRKDKQAIYFGIAVAHEGFQVLRFFEITAHYRAGEPADMFYWEVCQNWISPNGKYEVYSRKHTISWYTDSWCSDFEIRGKDINKYSINPYYFYPDMRFIPELKRNGLKRSFRDIPPIILIRMILMNSYAETLLKAKQYAALKYMSSHHECWAASHWPSLKICMRNAYTVKDPSIWTDYINALEYFGKDLRNAKYVCPENLKEAHDFWIRKMRIQEEKIRDEERRKRALEDEAKFKRLKSKFFGIMFTDGEIAVKVLDSIEEYLNEGKAMKHCVGSRNYYLKKDSIVLSARIDGSPVETVEVSLKTFKVVQSRGKCNMSTGYHNRIVDLVNKNVPVIRKAMKVKHYQEVS